MKFKTKEHWLKSYGSTTIVSYNMKFKTKEHWLKSYGSTTIVSYNMKFKTKEHWLKSYGSTTIVSYNMKFKTKEHWLKSYGSTTIVSYNMKFKTITNFCFFIQIFLHFYIELTLNKQGGWQPKIYFCGGGFVYSLSTPKNVKLKKSKRKIKNKKPHHFFICDGE